MKDNNLGISKEEIITILAEANQLNPKFSEAIYKIINKNNEMIMENIKKGKQKVNETARPKSLNDEMKKELQDGGFNI